MTGVGVGSLAGMGSVGWEWPGDSVGVSRRARSTRPRSFRGTDVCGVERLYRGVWEENRVVMSGLEGVEGERKEDSSSNTGEETRFWWCVGKFRQMTNVRRLRS